MTPTREPSVTANEADQLREAAAKVEPGDHLCVMPDLLLAALHTERLRGRQEAMEQIGMDMMHYDRSTDPSYVTVPTERIRSILRAVAGLSGEEPSDE